MKIRRIRILMAKGWCKVVCFVSFSLLSAFFNSVSAQKQSVVVSAVQDSVKAGDMIRGVVSDSTGPMMMVNVVERDAHDRIVAHGVTDIDGNFALRVVDPKDRLQITYVGFETVDTAIVGNYYDIRMKERKNMPMVDVNGMARVVTMADTIDMDQFVSLMYGVPDPDVISGAVIEIQERNQGMRARAYGPMYPRDNKPLLVLDGCIVDLLSVDTQCLDSIVSGNLYFDEAVAAKLFGIKERKIKSVSVLKDAAATAIWGMRGTNGVIEVRTKNDTHIGDRIRGRDDDPNRYTWESINEEIQKERSKTELDSLPGKGIYIPSDHSTYYSIEDLYNNWIIK